MEEGICRCSAPCRPTTSPGRTGRSVWRAVGRCPMHRGSALIIRLFQLRQWRTPPPVEIRGGHCPHQLFPQTSGPHHLHTGLSVHSRSSWHPFYFIFSRAFDPPAPFCRTVYTEVGIVEILGGESGWGRVARICPLRGFGSSYINTGGKSSPGS